MEVVIAVINRRSDLRVFTELKLQASRGVEPVEKGSKIAIGVVPDRR
jgi:hypothetical protein